MKKQIIKTKHTKHKTPKQLIHKWFYKKKEKKKNNKQTKTKINKTNNTCISTLYSILIVLNPLPVGPY